MSLGRFWRDCERQASFTNKKSYAVAQSYHSKSTCKHGDVHDSCGYKVTLPVSYLSRKAIKICQATYPISQDFGGTYVMTPFPFRTWNKCLWEMLCFWTNFMFLWDYSMPISSGVMGQNRTLFFVEDTNLNRGGVMTLLNLESTRTELNAVNVMLSLFRLRFILRFQWPFQIGFFLDWILFADTWIFQRNYWYYFIVYCIGFVF